MKRYTGYQWLLIDAANQWGLDKLIFEDRIQWTTENLDNLETVGTDRVLAELSLPNDKKWKESPLYFKAVFAIRKAQQGLPSGHMVGVDGCCSGIQVMSALTGCVAGATATGMIDPDVRADAYTKVTELMGTILGSAVSVSRADAKQSLMTAFYGSKQKPKQIFGESTPELDAFYKAATTVAPGAWELLQDLLGSWKPYALSHEWKMPDGFDVRIKVMADRTARIEVDELDHATFTYEFYENKGSKSGLSNAANVVHSFDAYIVREMHRRCNYDSNVALIANRVIENEMLIRASENIIRDLQQDKQVSYYVEQYERSTLANAAILPHLTQGNVQLLDNNHLDALASIVNSMLSHKPFPLVTIHDEFRSHANNVNFVRSTYIEIMAEIADSNVLDDVLSQLHNAPGSFNKLSFNLGDQIRKSNYALA